MASIGVYHTSTSSPGAMGGGGMVVGRVDGATTIPARHHGKVSIASYYTASHETSPRSCVVDIFSPEYHHRPHHARDDDVEMEEETPAEVAMLLASVADIAKKEMSCGLDQRPDLAIPHFPDLSSSGGSGFDDERMDDSNREGAELPHPPPMAMMHFDHKKTRAVSLDYPNSHHGRYEPVAAFQGRPVPTPPPHEDEAIPTLLRWRNLSCDAITDQPHQDRSTTSTTSPPPLTSSLPTGNALAAYPTCPRAVSMAEAAIENRPIVVPSTEVGDGATANDDERPMKLILRKKFSWKNYPDVSFCISFLSALDFDSAFSTITPIPVPFQFAMCTRTPPRSSRSSSSVRDPAAACNPLFFICVFFFPLNSHISSQIRPISQSGGVPPPQHPQLHHAAEEVQQLPNATHDQARGRARVHLRRLGVLVRHRPRSHPVLLQELRSEHEEEGGRDRVRREEGGPRDGGGARGERSHLWEDLRPEELGLGMKATAPFLHSY
jgi:hypothetical protein